MQGFVKVLRLFQFIGKCAQCIRCNRIEHRIGICNAAGGRRHAEFKLIARKCKRRGTVTVRRITVNYRQRGHADLHVRHLRHIAVVSGNDVFHNRGQLIAQEHGDDGRRRFAAAQTMIVARHGSTHAQKACMLIHSLHHGRQHQQEHVVALRRLARAEQVVSGVRRQRPVVVLAASVHARKRLFMQQAYKAVAQGNLFHDVHDEHILIRRLVRRAENRRQLMLRRRSLIVLGLRRHTQLPKLHVQVAHVIGHALLDRTEVMIFHLLAFGRHCAKKRTAGEDQVLALQIGFTVHDEIFLLRTDTGHNLLRRTVAEETADAHSLAADRLHRAQQRRLLIQRFTGIRAEDRGNAQRLRVAAVIKESRARDVPDGISTRFKRCTDAAGREGRRIRLALDELLAAQFHDHAAVLLRADEGIMLFRRRTGQRLKPVRVMRRAAFDRPLFHRAGRRIRHNRIQFLSGLHGALQTLIDRTGQACLHLLVAKDVDAIYAGNVKRFAHDQFISFSA